MGYRSTFVTNDISIKLPDWFMEKWKDHVHTLGKKLPIASRYEAKTYGIWTGLEEDLQKVLIENKETYQSIYITFLGEDGRICFSEITRDSITGDFPTKQ